VIELIDERVPSPDLVQSSSETSGGMITQDMITKDQVVQCPHDIEVNIRNNQQMQKADSIALIHRFIRIYNVPMERQVLLENAVERYKAELNELL
jgi:hypothetical protein